MFINKTASWIWYSLAASAVAVCLKSIKESVRVRCARLCVLSALVHKMFAIVWAFWCARTPCIGSGVKYLHCLWQTSRCRNGNRLTKLNKQICILDVLRCLFQAVYVCRHQIFHWAVEAGVYFSTKFIVFFFVFVSAFCVIYQIYSFELAVFGHHSRLVLNWS